MNNPDTDYIEQRTPNELKQRHTTQKISNKHTHTHTHTHITEN